MSERKVLNKYYPPDFDPSKIPKLRLPKNRQYSIRIMAPFNMKCNTCGEYIYKGKKFNSRKETVEDENYLGLHIFRFYIKCPRCISEIAFKTDPEKTDYALEDGATRNFEALRTAGELAEAEAKAKEEEEAGNPMKLLENRTKASQREMDMLETLEDLKNLNKRHAKVDHEGMIAMATAYKEQLRKLQDEEDEEFLRSAFSYGDDGFRIKRLREDDDDDEQKEKHSKKENPTDHLDEQSDEANLYKKPFVPTKSLSSKRNAFGVMIKKKNTDNNSNSTNDIQTDENLTFVTTKKTTNEVKSSNECLQTNINSSTDVANKYNDIEQQSTMKSPQIIPSSSLSLVGNYSGSDSDQSDDS